MTARAVAERERKPQAQAKAPAAVASLAEISRLAGRHPGSDMWVDVKEVAADG